MHLYRKVHKGQPLNHDGQTATHNITYRASKPAIAHCKSPDVLCFPIFAKVLSNLVTRISQRSAYDSAMEEYEDDPDSEVRQEMLKELDDADDHQSSLQSCPQPNI